MDHLAFNVYNVVYKAAKRANHQNCPLTMQLTLSSFLKLPNAEQNWVKTRKKFDQNGPKINQTCPVGLLCPLLMALVLLHWIKIGLNKWKNCIMIVQIHCKWISSYLETLCFILLSSIPKTVWSWEQSKKLGNECKNFVVILPLLFLL